MLPPVRIEPGKYNSKYDTLLSELTWISRVSLRLQIPTSDAALILTKSSKFKCQVLHKQKKFSRSPNYSTCQVSAERRVLDLELESQVQSSLKITFCSWIFLVFFT